MPHWFSVTPCARLRQLFTSVPQASADADSSEPRSAGSRVQWLVVGLGNPGARYEGTRHNVGFLVLEQLTDGASAVAAHELRGIPAHAWEAQWDEACRVILACPTTFMNESGRAVAALARRYEVPPQRIVVIHDELDLPLGTIRLRKGGSENGHNGLKSVTEQLHSPDYLRVRMGIDRPEKGLSVVDHVLGPLPDSALVEESCSAAAAAARLLAIRGLSRAQNEVHGRRH